MKAGLASVLIMCTAVPGIALSDVKIVDIVRVGGQVTNMFIDVSPAVGTDLACPGNRIVIPPGIFDTDAQKRFYAALLSAIAAGKKMELAVSGCNGPNPTMISTDFWFLQTS